MKATAAIRHLEMQQKMAAITAQLDDIRNKTETAAVEAQQNPAEFEHFIADYRAKLLQLEDLIHALVPRSESDAEQPLRPPSPERPTWLDFMTRKLQSLKSTLNHLRSPTTITITRLVPTGKHPPAHTHTHTHPSSL